MCVCVCILFITCYCWIVRIGMRWHLICLIVWHWISLIIEQVLLGDRTIMCAFYEGILSSITDATLLCVSECVHFYSHFCQSHSLFTATRNTTHANEILTLSLFSSIPLLRTICICVFIISFSIFILVSGIFCSFSLSLPFHVLIFYFLRTSRHYLTVCDKCFPPMFWHRSIHYL